MNVLSTGYSSLYYTKNTNDEINKYKAKFVHVELMYEAGLRSNATQVKSLVRSRTGCLLYCQTFSCDCTSFMTY